MTLCCSSSTPSATTDKPIARPSEMMVCAIAVAGHFHQDVADESPVDFQFVQGQAPQIGQGRIAGAKVVQREAQAVRLEFGHLGDDVLDIVHQHALGEFQFELRGLAPVRSSAGQHLVHKVVLAELASADIDRNHEMGGFLPVGPYRDLRAGGLQNPICPRAESTPSLPPGR